jgi:hypothetical protein
MMETHSFEPKLHSVQLAAPFDLGSLIEALVLYKNVELIVSEDGTFPQLIDWLSPSGILSFFEEFFETVTIRARNQMVVHSHVLDSDFIQIGFLDQILGDRTALQYMREKSFLSYDKRDGSRVLGGWQDSRVDGFLRRIEMVPWTPDNFLSVLFRDIDDLAWRFRAYLQALGGPVLESIRFSDVEVSDYVVDSLTITDTTGVNPQKLKTSFVKYLDDRIAAYGPSVLQPQSHLIASGAGAFILSYDCHSLLDRLRPAMLAREYLNTLVIPDVPRIADACAKYAVLPARVLHATAKARRRRLELPDDVQLGEVVRAVIKTPWFNSLPLKVARWSLFTGAGVAFDLAGAGGMGTAGGVGLSALDGFFLDRLARRWSPDQYLLGYRASLEKLAKRLASSDNTKRVR